jgi:hypothetical protein
MKKPTPKPVPREPGGPTGHRRFKGTGKQKK